MVGLTVVIAAVTWHRSERAARFDLESPLSLTVTAKFSVAYASILLVSLVVEAWFGDLRLYATAFADGLVSSVTVAVSAATVFSDGGVGPQQAAGTVVLGITASLTAKSVLIELESGRMRWTAAVPMALVGVAGPVVFVLT